MKARILNDKYVKQYLLITLHNTDLSLHTVPEHSDTRFFKT